MLEFIRLLRQRYQAVLPGLAKSCEQEAFGRQIERLMLAEALLAKGELLAQGPLPLQIAVIGPTQVGKSSVANVLLGGNDAGVSPLAGHTVQPQGFCQQVAVEACGILQRYFGHFQWLARPELARRRHDCYSLSPSTGVSDLLPPCVLWDTPDFDSIDSSAYREGVVKAAALADIIVLVVSKEKYADQSVWEMMAALEPLRQPTLVCLNKLSAETEAVLLSSLGEKWRSARGDEPPEVVCLRHQQPGALPAWPAAQADAVKRLAAKVRRKRQRQVELRLLQQHWPDWTRPLRQEHQALADWQGLVQASLAQALAHYQRDYLDHPQHYETFQQALLELLVLLEVPGLAGALAHLRRALTWPLRQLFRLGGKPSGPGHNQETAVLNQVAEHTLLQLAEHLLDGRGQTAQALWWRDLAALLRRQRPTVLYHFHLAVKVYQLGFRQRIEQTARQLYQKLQEQPLLLNSLRTARVSADAAAIAVTLHTGGVGVHDLVIGPAMLSLTSWLAESAIGGYVHGAERRLRQQQLAAVRQTLFDDVIGHHLLALPGQLATPTFNIPPETLAAAERQLMEKPHGLQLL